MKEDRAVLISCVIIVAIYIIVQALIVFIFTR